MPKAMKVDKAWTKQPEGMMVYCPGCRGVHIYDKRWTYSGDDESPTFKPSYVIRHSNKDGEGAFVCHSFLTDGVFSFLGDSTHEFAGKTVPAEDFKYGP